jgi:hypothetical protein
MVRRHLVENHIRENQRSANCGYVPDDLLDSAAMAVRLREWLNRPTREYYVKTSSLMQYSQLSLEGESQWLKTGRAGRKLP